MSCATSIVHPISCVFMIFGLTLARSPPQLTAAPVPLDTARRCTLDERLFNAVLVNSTKKLGDGLFADEAMGVTIDDTDWSELNITREEAKECLKEYFKDEDSDDIKDTSGAMGELPASDEADDDEKVTTYLKPYNFRAKGYFVKKPKDKNTSWSKVSQYYDKFIDQIADLIGISE